MFCLMSKYYSSSLFSRLLSCLIYLVYNYLLIMLTTYVCSDLNTFYEILSGHVSTYAGTRALERRNEDSRHQALFYFIALVVISGPLLRQVIILLIYFMDIKTYLLVILLECDRLAYQHILFIHIQIYIISLELYVKYIMRACQDDSINGLNRSCACQNWGHYNIEYACYYLKIKKITLD